jgi:hypothetical protein
MFEWMPAAMAVAAALAPCQEGGESISPYEGADRSPHLICLDVFALTFGGALDAAYELEFASGWAWTVQAHYNGRPRRTLPEETVGRGRGLRTGIKWAWDSDGNGLAGPYSFAQWTWASTYVDAPTTHATRRQTGWEFGMGYRWRRGDRSVVDLEGGWMFSGRDAVAVDPETGEEGRLEARSFFLAVRFGWHP